MTRRKALFVEGPDVWVILPPESEVPFSSAPDSRITLRVLSPRDALIHPGWRLVIALRALMGYNVAR